MIIEDQFGAKTVRNKRTDRGRTAIPGHTPVGTMLAELVIGLSFTFSLYGKQGCHVDRLFGSELVCRTGSAVWFTEMVWNCLQVQMVMLSCMVFFEAKCVSFF
ncbi:uncharacterized protein LOC131661962 [Vicia villosa]|uniref:uncharacterized protein LOC131661962 n=1 Tax=Vicia villosa TaxID=3911 RepID=UPI00273C13FF|nr:uncharacterized protein LOC131661962 [Vicia villosa]